MTPIYRILSFYILVVFALSSKTLNAQEDSLFIDLAQLSWNDIKSTQQLAVGTKVISGSRSEKEITDLPFTIFVVTGEEIRQKGYLTLTDVLKRLPGIRVSQPGSALEGETFMMRGLSGNTYAKILINDVPIKPFIASGMPIGAQLPIREAERIEIIYGPAATLYGADASAGVINIIMKDTERPIYVQADLGFGGDGYENLDVMFSGKIGKNKKVLKFRIYGNYTSFDDRRIKYDTDSLYNPDTYQDILRPNDFSYLDRPNYLGGEGAPLLGKLPHLSTAFGIDLRYRAWQLTVHRFARRDHSSIGLSPYAVSYANPLNFFGEEITAVNLNFSKSINKFRYKIALGGLAYLTDPRSSHSYVIPLNNFIQQTGVINLTQDQVRKDSIRKVFDELYYSGTRFSSALSGEGNLEILMSYTANKFIEIAGGINLQGGAGEPLLSFNKVPLDNLDDSTNLNRIESNLAGYVDLSSFVECYFNFKKWNAIIGAQVFARQTNYLSIQNPNINPRLALQYRWTNALSIRASTSRSYRYPSPYYDATTYRIDFNNIDSLKTGETNLSPEKTYSAEFGFRWTPAHWKVFADASFFYNRTDNFIRFSVISNRLETPTLTTGYTNDTQASAKLYGVQSSITFTDLVPAIGLSTTLNLNYVKGREISNNFSLVSEELIPLDLDGLRAQPSWIAQLDLKLQLSKNLRLVFENTWMTESLTRNALKYQVPELAIGDDLHNPGYYTLDALASYQFNRNIVGYVRINNLLNKKYAGIDASADIDGLLYNPQSKSFMRFGINYRLE